ncbi:hypothetical protein ACET3Z_001908 [Daucus carota]
MACFEQWKQVIAMVGASFCLAIVNILLKKVLSGGLDHLLIIFYRQIISTIFLSPIAYFWERKSRPKPTIGILCDHFLSALIGVTLTQYLFLLGLKFTSATFSCAFINMVPVITFIMAMPFGLEKVNLKHKSGRAKVFGALVSVGGALLLTLYKGIPLRDLPTPLEDPTTGGTKRWGTGTLLLTGGSIMWSSWFLIQAKIGKTYPCQYSSTAMISFFSTIQSALLYVAIHRNTSAWLIKGSLEILTVLFAGMVGSGLCYVIMSWCVKERGPVFTSAFSPLIQIFVAAFDITFLHEQIHLGSVLGSVLVVAGMYILLWGKINEAVLCNAIKPVTDPAMTAAEEI